MSSTPNPTNELQKWKPRQSIRRVAAAVVLSLTAFTSLALGQNSFLDITMGRQFVDEPAAVPATISYHAYPWMPPERKYIPAVEAAAETPSKQLCFDYEPWAFSEEHKQSIFRKNAVDVDPLHEAIENVERQHQQYAEAIAAILPLAKASQVKVGTYSFLSLGHRRLEQIRSDGPRYDRWRQDQERVLQLPVIVDGRQSTLLALLNETGGAVWVPWYVPNGWNTPKLAWKAPKAFPRVCAAIEAAGGKAIPILNPNTVSGNKGNPALVLPEIQRELVRLAKAKHGNEWAIWAKPDQVTPEFRELIREELRR